MTKLYNVTPAYGSKTVSVLASSCAEALEIAKSKFSKKAKLGAQETTVKVGGQVARAVHANRGIEVAYRREMEAMIAEMHGSVQYWLTAAYRKNPPRMAKVVKMAEDAAPSAKVKAILDELARRWIKKFDDWAPRISEAYVKSMFKATDSSFRQALKDAGWTVDFKLTPAIRDALTASIEENVGLIRSIPQEYLQQVEGIVMRSYSAGRNLETMVKDLKALYPKVGDRAELIARDQSNKANATVNRTRSLQLGLTEAIWMHSSAGKVPRPSHLKAGKDKLRYKIAEGAFIDGEYIQPGQLINCRCTSRVVLPI